MRVMQVMAGAQHGGAEAFFVRLTVALSQAGIASHAVARPFAHRSEALRAGGVGVTELPFGNWFDFATRPKLAAAIADFEPDVVMSWMNRATSMVPKSPKMDDGRRMFLHVGRLGGYYDLKYYRNCHHLIGNTRDIVDYIIRSGWPAGRAHLLPNFAEEAGAPPLPRATFDTPDDVPLFLGLGRLHENKGFDVLLDAVAMLPRAHLWLAGEGPLRKALVAQAERLGVAGRVHFLGWRSDVAALMASADALVCSSRHEPLGNVVIEAWTHGLPVIAADAAGPASLIADGETGWLVPRDDAGALAGAMAKLATDKSRAAAVAAAARAVYREHFSKQAVVGQYLAFFERIMAGNSSGAVTGSATQG